MDRRGSISNRELFSILVRYPSRRLSTTTPSRARRRVAIFGSDWTRRFFRTTATAWIKIFGLYVKEGHLLPDPLDRIAPLGVFHFFNLLFQCFALRQESAVSGVHHLGRVFFYD